VEKSFVPDIPVELHLLLTSGSGWRGSFQEWGGALRYVGIHAAIPDRLPLILRPVKKQALAAFKQIPRNWHDRPWTGGRYRRSREWRRSSGGQAKKQARGAIKTLTAKIKASRWRQRSGAGLGAGAGQVGVGKHGTCRFITGFRRQPSSWCCWRGVASTSIATIMSRVQADPTHRRSRSIKRRRLAVLEEYSNSFSPRASCDGGPELHASCW